MSKAKRSVIAKVKGSIVQGAKKATELGFPTINIVYDVAVQLPQVGVYAGELEFGGMKYPGAVCLGEGAGDAIPKLEIYCFDDVPIKHGDRATIVFLKRLSDFVSGNDSSMKQKIANDVLAAVRFFGESR